MQPDNRQSETVLAADCHPADIDPALLDAASITIHFAHFSDGRGLSLARNLRDTHHYHGTIIASGDLLPDQWPELRSAGFDRVIRDDVARADDRPRDADSFVRRSYTHSFDSSLHSIWRQRHVRQ